MSEEKRRAPRINITAWAHITVKGESASKLGTVANISRVGLGIQMKELIEAGTFVAIELKFLDEAQGTITWKTSGTVVRCASTENGHFLGVDFAVPITILSAPEMDVVLRKNRV